MNESKFSEHRVLIIGVLIIVIIFGYLILKGGNIVSTTKSSNTTSSTGEKPAPANLISAIAAVPQTVLNQIGVGSANVLPKHISAPSLVSQGKPEVFYQGAEFCPYCATERWAMVQALSRFGTFSKLGETHSSTTDVYPDTKTLDFYQSVYTSPYITFVPLEMYTNIASASGGYTVLQTPTSAETNIINFRLIF